MESFYTLPPEIQRKEIYEKHLDDLSRLIVRKTLLNLPYEREDFIEIICEQIVSYGMEMTRLFFSYLNKKNISAYAAKYGHLDVLIFTLENDCFWNGETSCEIAKYDRFEMVEYLWKKQNNILTMIGRSAAKYGNIRIIKFLWENGKYLDDLCLGIAAEHGHLDIVKYCHENNVPYSGNITSRAASSGKVDVVIYCHENIESCAKSHLTSTYAAQGGNIQVLKYCLDNGAPTGTGLTLCNAAASTGSVEMLKYCKERGMLWNENTFRSAVSSNNLDMVKYCYENDCPWDNGITMHTKSLEVIKFLHQNGFPWCNGTCNAMAGYGKLDILKYCINNNCSWNWLVCMNATINGHKTILEYTKLLGCSCSYHM